MSRHGVDVGKMAFPDLLAPACFVQSDDLDHLLGVEISRRVIEREVTVLANAENAEDGLVRFNLRRGTRASSASRSGASPMIP